MIENTLTYQFSGVGKGNEITPDALVLKLSDGTQIKYVPEVVKPESVFKTGQIVEVVGENLSMSGWRGIVVSTNQGTIKVEFGRELNGLSASSFTFSQPKNLHLIHNVT